MDHSYLLTVALIWTVAAITPGPNFLAMTRYSLAGSRRTAFAAGAGTVIGTFGWGISGWLGVSTLFTAAPAAYVLLKLIGGAYILWLGLRVLRGLLRQPTGPADPAPALPRTPAEAFRVCLATNLANPKTAVFVASVFATALPADPSWSQGLFSALLMTAISGCWYTLLALTLTSRSVAQGYLAARRWVDAATGTIFVGFGTALLLSSR